MILHGLTVCVDYADLLKRTLPAWLKGLDSLVVVSTFEDVATRRVCMSHGLLPMVTDAFYACGAKFNKGGAMEEAVVRRLPPPGPDVWYVVFDSDMLPVEGWQKKLAALQPRRGWLHGAVRLIAERPTDATDPPAGGLRAWHDRELPGYFWVFHSLDGRLAQRPWFSSWKHAGGYDSDFQDRWGQGPAMDHKVRWTPDQFRLVHLGIPGRNWCGTSPEARAELDAMMRERIERGGYQHERLHGPTAA